MAVQEKEVIMTKDRQAYVETHINCPYVSQSVRLERELFHVWCFLASEGINEEALEYLRDHSDDPAPFELRT